MRRNEPGVNGGLNASRVGLYGGSRVPQPTLWTVTERPQRLATFETFDESDEAK